MAIELKVPEVGESITEVMISEWLKAEGDWVEADEPLVIIETDKTDVELPAPEAGTLTKILKADGADAEVGDVIGTFEAGEKPAGAKAPAQPEAGAEAEPEPTKQEAGGEAGAAADQAAEAESAEAESAEAEAESAEPAEAKSAEAGAAAEAERDEAAAEAEEQPAKGAAEPRVTPAARRVLAEKGLDAAEVEATGPGGRLLKEDVLRHEAKPAEPEKKAPAKAEPPPAPAASGSRQEEAVKMTPLRRRVADRLVEAQQTAALLTTFNEIDMSAVMALRREYKETFLEKHDVKLGFMSFFVKAVVEALKDVPQVNAEIRGREIVYRNYQDIGIAVGGGKGLVVPILRNAERMSFAEVEKTIGDFAVRARDGKLKLEELQGGTFTISNGGIYGSLLSTPIVNPPQSGILGMHKIEERPIAKDGEVVIRPMMYVALTYDHRIVDGREAVTFLVRVKERIEDPTRILLEV